MIQDIVAEAVRGAEALEALTAMYNHVRTLASSDDEPEHSARANAAVSRLIAAMPEDTAFRMLEHCSTLTRLYAIWERFVTQTVGHWLDELPSYHNAYSELSNQFAANHRRGVGRVLLDLDKGRFSHMTPDQVISGLLDAVTGRIPYRILPEAFLSDSRSLKRERLVELFTQIGMKNVWEWVSGHRVVKSYLTDVKGDQNTADAELRSFIDYRNEAAHGNVTEVLGSGLLIETAQYVRAICMALGEFVHWNQVNCLVAAGKLAIAGRVSESFNGNIVVAKLTDCEVKTGNQVIVHGPKYCYLVTIESIKLDDVAHESVTITEEREVGIKFQTYPQKSPVLFIPTEGAS